MKKLLSLVIVVLFGALLARTCLYTVNEREYALVFMLGELKRCFYTRSACQAAGSASKRRLFGQTYSYDRYACSRSGSNQ